MSDESREDAKFKWSAVAGGITLILAALGGGTIYLSGGNSDNGKGGEGKGEGHKYAAQMLSDMQSIRVQLKEVLGSVTSLSSRCAEGVVRDSHLAEEVRRLDRSIQQVQGLLLQHIGIYHPRHSKALKLEPQEDE